jgi:hypothetical protein
MNNRHACCALLLVFAELALPPQLAGESNEPGAKASQAPVALSKKTYGPAGKPCVEGSGIFTVRGVVYDPVSGKAPIPKNQVRVVLARDGKSSEFDMTNEDGEYCIPFQGGAQIKVLYFQSPEMGRTCITELSGERNHIINKILEANCEDAIAQLTVTQATRALASLLLSKNLDKQFEIVQVGYINISDKDVLLLSAGIDRKAGCPAAMGLAAADQNKESTSNLIRPVDPELVALAAESERQKGFVLLRFGPVSLMTINHGAQFESTQLMMQHAFRPNQMVPRGASVDLVMFFPRSAASEKGTGVASSLHILGRRVPSSAGEGELTDSDIVSACSNLPEA